MGKQGEGSAAEPQVITFVGRGNREDDARQNANIRYDTWKIVQRRSGNAINEISAEHSFIQKNEVSCRCNLVVTYTLSSD